VFKLTGALHDRNLNPSGKPSHATVIQNVKAAIDSKQPTITNTQNLTIK
jgi:hypothetical protein